MRKLINPMNKRPLEKVADKRDNKIHKTAEEAANPASRDKLVARRTGAQRLSGSSI
jgi:hypothetical protein